MLLLCNCGHLYLTFHILVSTDKKGKACRYQGCLSCTKSRLDEAFQKTDNALQLMMQPNADQAWILFIVRRREYSFVLTLDCFP